MTMKKQPLPSTAALGRKVTRFTQFDTFKTPKGVHRVTCISDEVTANCPVTNQPDWYKVEIEYQPSELCVESKSLKLYLQHFRNQGHFCEKFASIIAHDIQKALVAHRVHVQITQKARGGVSIVACASADTSKSGF
jgi:7-cyano-7-deazaguanine reductase